MTRILLWLLLLPGFCYGQTEDEFLPEVTYMVVDSTEIAVQRFCKQVMGVTTGFKFAFVDREDIMMSKYMYDNTNFETVRFEFQFDVEEVLMPDSTTRKNRIVKMMTITAELPTMTKIYTYLFNEVYTPEKLMAVSMNDKAINYKGTVYNSRIIVDDYKPGYWILSFFKL